MVTPVIATSSSLSGSGAPVLFWTVAEMASPPTPGWRGGPVNVGDPIVKVVEKPADVLPVPDPPLVYIPAATPQTPRASPDAATITATLLPTRCLMRTPAKWSQ